MIARARLGMTPVIGALALTWAIFQFANSNFLSAVNLTNLLLQIAAMGTIACGLVLVLLLGEIDLSAGAVSGLCAAIMAILQVRYSLPASLSIILALVAGALIGCFHGLWITRLRVPSFIVTLAGLIGWQGALLAVLGSTGTVNLRDPLIVGLAGTFFPSWSAWLVGFACIIVFAWSELSRRGQRLRAGLAAAGTRDILVRIAGASLVTTILAGILSADRGLPSALLLVGAIVAALHTLTTRTRFGRHIYATGSNAEAARRASISVDNVRVVVFALSSTLAAAGGILAASRLLAVNQSSGSGDVLLNAIAAAVIGGTSLFGGRGNVPSALVGALVIGSISNGMDLVALPSSIKFMITGAVLLVAVTIDAVGRQRAPSR